MARDGTIRARSRSQSGIEVLMLPVSCWPWCLGDARLAAGAPAGRGRHQRVVPWRPAGSSAMSRSFADVGRRHGRGTVSDGLQARFCAFTVRFASAKSSQWHSHRSSHSGKQTNGSTCPPRDGGPCRLKNVRRVERYEAEYHIAGVAAGRAFASGFRKLHRSWLTCSNEVHAACG
jgi:hypothetical protein